jgi:hypothetical protein
VLRAFTPTEAEEEKAMEWRKILGFGINMAETRGHVLSPEFDPINIGQIGSAGGPKAKMSFIVNYNWNIVRPIRPMLGQVSPLYLR